MKCSLLFITLAAMLCYACSPTRKVSRESATALDILLADSALAGTHTGVYVYNPTSQKALYSYQSDKYFVPASNTKLFSCYAGMKYLGDSLVGLRYATSDDSTILLKPTADPTFFHEDYILNPVIKFLKSQKKPFRIDASGWREEGLGSGWAWNDYDELYMAERSPMPIYGNTMMVSGFENSSGNDYLVNVQTQPSFKIESRSIADTAMKSLQFKRLFSLNTFLFKGPGKGSSVKSSIPFVTNKIETTVEILRGTPFNIDIQQITNRKSEIINPKFQIIHSQPTDSLFKPMMHRSDNFFAEQTLLMVSNEKLGYMNDRAIIDTLIKTDLADLPQKPVWVDGSGLSRYNLFTPQDFVAILGKLKNEFGIERMKNILPTGGEGTISSYYKSIAHQIFVKTGTLSGQVALSGYLFTKSNTLLLFSILVNNHTNTATNVRKAVEKFIMDTWAKN